MTLRSRVIKLAATHDDLRLHLLPLLRTAGSGAFSLGVLQRRELSGPFIEVQFTHVKSDVAFSWTTQFAAKWGEWKYPSTQRVEWKATGRGTVKLQGQSRQQMRAHNLTITLIKKDENSPATILDDFTQLFNTLIIRQRGIIFDYLQSVASPTVKVPTSSLHDDADMMLDHYIGKTDIAIVYVPGQYRNHLTEQDLRKYQGSQRVPIPFPGRQGPTLMTTRPLENADQALQEGNAVKKKYEIDLLPGGMAAVVAIVAWLDLGKFSAVLNTHYSDS